MLTEYWKSLFSRIAPTVHPRLELIADDGTVVFVQELTSERLRPGDSITITWKYEEPGTLGLQHHSTPRS